MSRGICVASGVGRVVGEVVGRVGGCKPVSAAARPQRQSAEFYLLPHNRNAGNRRHGAYARRRQQSGRLTTLFTLYRRAR